jgi:hypothetical protein
MLTAITMILLFKAKAAITYDEAYRTYHSNSLLRFSQTLDTTYKITLINYQGYYYFKVYS